MCRPILALLRASSTQRALLVLFIIVFCGVLVLQLTPTQDTAQEQGPVLHLKENFKERSAQVPDLNALLRMDDVAEFVEQLTSFSVHREVRAAASAETAARNVEVASSSPGSSWPTEDPEEVPEEMSTEPSLLLPNISLQARPECNSHYVPSVSTFFPHLNSPSSMRPAYYLSRGRSCVSIVLGIPTVKRARHNYLMSTLMDLIDNMTPVEAADTLIIVLVAETNRETVLQVSKQLKEQFGKEMQSGLLDVISPPAAYYPNMQSLQPTLGDSLKRTRWRSKQNLDYAFLMMYAQPRGQFYVQLEDDIKTTKHFVSIMKKYALKTFADKFYWVVLEFCRLGFIGKMFKSVDLPKLIHFLLMFYNEKPVDWLLNDFISIIRNKIYDNEQSNMQTIFPTSLFQHIGVQSSLKGKKQHATDGQFGTIKFFPHRNPEAQISSVIKHYQYHSLLDAYDGRTFFWGITPQPGDQVIFTFTKPIVIKRYLFRSGNPDYPFDIFYSTTVEVLPYDQTSYNKNHFITTSKGFVIVGQFNDKGIATGVVPSELGSINKLRLYVNKVIENWTILSEIEIVSDELVK